MASELEVEVDAYTSRFPVSSNATTVSDLPNCTPFVTTLSTVFRVRNQRGAVLDIQNSSHVSLFILHVIESAIIASIVLTSVALFERETYQIDSMGYTVLVKRSLTDVLKEWTKSPTNSPFFLIPILFFFVLPIVASFASWVFLSNLHRAGSIVASFKRAYLSILACCGLLNVLFAIILSITTTVNLIDYGSNIVLRGACGISMTIVVCLLILTFLVRLDRATKFAGELLPEVEAIANRCEGCGYDLTHLPIGGVCTECGLATESSLVPERRRPGTPWQQRRDVLGWLETVGDCLLWPHRIYGAMQMKKAFAESVRFARWHFGVMAVGAALWAILLTQTQSELGWPVYLFVPLMAAAAASLAGWFWHRLVGAIVFTYAVAQKLFTDAQWGRHVLMYESAFLWVFCAFNGLMITSFIVFDGNWISHFFTGRQLFFFLGMPLELFVILMGNLVLTLAWFYRYSIAIRAVRWSNF